MKTAVNFHGVWFTGNEFSLMRNENLDGFDSTECHIYNFMDVFEKPVYAGEKLVQKSKETYFDKKVTVFESEDTHFEIRISDSLLRKFGGRKNMILHGTADNKIVAVSRSEDNVLCGFVMPMTPKR